MTLTVVVVMVAVVVVVTTLVMVNVEVTSVVVAIVARPRGCAPPAIVVAPFRGVGVVRLAVELLVKAGSHDGVSRVECRTG